MATANELRLLVALAPPEPPAVRELLESAASDVEELERLRPLLEELWPLLAKARSCLRSFTAAGARNRHPLYVNAERDAAAVVEELEELEPLLRYGRKDSSS